MTSDMLLLRSWKTCFAKSQRLESTWKPEWLLSMWQTPRRAYLHLACRLCSEDSKRTFMQTNQANALHQIGSEKLAKAGICYLQPWPYIVFSETKVTAAEPPSAPIDHQSMLLGAIHPENRGQIS